MYGFKGGILPMGDILFVHELESLWGKLVTTIIEHEMSRA